MFVVLSKLLDLLLSPLTWVLLLVAGSIVWRRRPRRCAWLAGSAIAVALVFATKPLPNRLARYAESSARSTIRPEVTYDAVIVLGGTMSTDVTERTGELEYEAAVDRVLRGFELVRSGWARHVLFSAGTLDDRPGALREGDLAKLQMELWGIPAELVVSENRSRNTRENALESLEVVRSRGWKSLVLVTSAAHMKRALECFHAVGLEPDTMPVDFRADDLPLKIGDLLPRAGPLAASTDVIRELAGRVIYRVVGYSKP